MFKFTNYSVNGMQVVLNRLTVFISPFAAEHPRCIFFYQWPKVEIINIGAFSLPSECVIVKLLE